MYANEISKNEKLRILIRVNYGYYVVERILIRCHNESVKANLRDEIWKNLGYLGNNLLKNKWYDLLERS